MAGTATAGVSSPSFGSVVVNGQLVGTQTSSAYRPINYGGGISAVPSASPVTIPPAVGYGQPGNATAYGAPVGSGPGGGGTPSMAQRGSTETGFFSTANAGGFGAPAFWGLLLLIIGLVWLKKVHWHKGEGGKFVENADHPIFFALAITAVVIGGEGVFLWAAKNTNQSGLVRLIQKG